MLFVLLKIDFQRERVLFIPLKKGIGGGGGGGGRGEELTSLT